MIKNKKLILTIGVIFMKNNVIGLNGPVDFFNVNKDSLLNNKKEADNWMELNSGITESFVDYFKKSVNYNYKQYLWTALDKKMTLGLLSKNGKIAYEKGFFFPFEIDIKGNKFPSILLSGNSGSGKSTGAYWITETMIKAFDSISYLKVFISDPKKTNECQSLLDFTKNIDIFNSLKEKEMFIWWNYVKKTIKKQDKTNPYLNILIAEDFCSYPSFIQKDMVSFSQKETSILFLAISQKYLSLDVNVVSLFDIQMFYQLIPMEVDIDLTDLTEKGMFKVRDNFLKLEKITPIKNKYHKSPLTKIFKNIEEIIFELNELFIVIPLNFLYFVSKLCLFFIITILCIIGLWYSIDYFTIPKQQMTLYSEKGNVIEIKCFNKKWPVKNQALYINNELKFEEKKIKINNEFLKPSSQKMLKECLENLK